MVISKKNKWRIKKQEYKEKSSGLKRNSGTLQEGGSSLIRM